jgi:ABC-type branched-subunit amino acid transport system ATPase component
MEFADRHHILYGGGIIYSEGNDKFKQDQEVQKRYLGI